MIILHARRSWDETIREQFLSDSKIIHAIRSGPSGVVYLDVSSRLLRSRYDAPHNSLRICRRAFISSIRSWPRNAINHAEIFPTTLSAGPASTLELLAPPLLERRGMPSGGLENTWNPSSSRRASVPGGTQPNLGADLRKTLDAAAICAKPRMNTSRRTFLLALLDSGTAAPRFAPKTQASPANSSCSPSWLRGNQRVTRSRSRGQIPDSSRKRWPRSHRAARKGKIDPP